MGYTSDQSDDDDEEDDADDEGDGTGDSNNGGVTDDEVVIRRTPPTAKGTLDDPDMATLITGVEAIPTYEISSTGILERKCRCAAIESAVPLPKRRRHEVPICTFRQGEKNKLLYFRTAALMDIEKKINMKPSQFKGGHNGLQAC